MALPDRIVLAQPPFFRLFGSHNNRGPLELAYLAGRLADQGLECTILNLDQSAADVHCTWRNLFERSPLLGPALTGRSPLLYEAAEHILGLAPDIVVLSAGDALTPWVDLGNAYVAARLADLLRPHGVRCVGTGSLFATAAPQIRPSFDAVIDDVFDIRAMTRLLPTAARPVQWQPAPPLVSADASGSVWDVVMSSFGCIRSCTFCDAGRQDYRQLPPEVFARDVAQRGRRRLDIGDAIFLARGSRLSALADELSATGQRPEFSVELAVAQATTGRLRELADFGVTEIKVGIESADVSALRVMGKPGRLDQARDACHRIHELGLDLTVYVLLGGPVPDPREAALRTLEFCRELPTDNVVVNVWAYNRPGARATDTHFSWDLVTEYGLTDVMEEFFKLQAPNKHSIGRLVDIR